MCGEESKGHGRVEAKVNREKKKGPTRVDRRVRTKFWGLFLDTVLKGSLGVYRRDV